MGHIAIRLNPRDLPNPDADLRDRIPEVVGNATDGRIRDDGYDYIDGDVMIVFLVCEDPASDVGAVIETLRANKICDNQLLDSAVIDISTDATKFSIVHPPGDDGVFCAAND